MTCLHQGGSWVQPFMVFWRGRRDRHHLAQQTWPECLGGVLALPPSCCVALDQFVSLSEHMPSLLYSGDNGPHLQG